MQPGAIWRLRVPTMGICESRNHFNDVQRDTILLPAEALIKVVSPSSQGAFVEVEWERKRISLFAIDLQERGDQIPS